MGHRSSAGLGNRASGGLSADAYSCSPFPAYSRVTFEAGTGVLRRASPLTARPLCTAQRGTASRCRLSTTVGDSLLSQPLESYRREPVGHLARATNLPSCCVALTAVKWKLVEGMLARAPLAGGSAERVAADVRWARRSCKGELAVVNYVDGHSRLRIRRQDVYESGGWISNIRFAPQGEHDCIHGSSCAWTIAARCA